MTQATGFSADMHRNMAQSYRKLAETRADMVVRKKLLDAAAWRDAQAARLEGVISDSGVPAADVVAPVDEPVPARSQKSRKAKG